MQQDLTYLGLWETRKNIALSFPNPGARKPGHIHLSVLPSVEGCWGGHSLSVLPLAHGRVAGARRKQTLVCRGER